MTTSLHSSNDLFPFPLSPPSLDATRRRRAPSALKLGAAYQKRIPRTFRKFHSPIHPNEESEWNESKKENTEIFSSFEIIKTGKLVLNHGKIGTVRRYTATKERSPSQKDSKEYPIQRGEQVLSNGVYSSSFDQSSIESEESPSQNSIEESAFVHDGMTEEEKVERRTIYEQVNALLKATQEEAH